MSIGGAKVCKFIVSGKRPLSGKIKIHGAKNSALPLLAGSLLSSESVILRDIPRLRDVRVMVQIIESLGGNITDTGEELYIDVSDLTTGTIPMNLMREMRSSIVLLAGVLHNVGWVKVFPPGGCAIGERPIDLHLKGLEQLGCEITQDEESVIISAPRGLYGATIKMEYPSVGATENLIMAAAKAKGVTKIINPAKEPEIQDLADFINSMGGEVIGAGTNKITVKGKRELHGTDHRIIFDRIVAGTYMTAAAITGGEITLTNIVPEHVQKVVEVLKRCGAQVIMGDKNVTVSAKGINLISPGKIETEPYPGFPTDMQPQLMALSSVVTGNTVINENIFDGRFKHVPELRKMGANIKVDNKKATILGSSGLTGTIVTASDLRAGAALILAGLSAEGVTVVEDNDHIDRGYQSFDTDLVTLGAAIDRINSPNEMFLRNGNA